MKIVQVLYSLGPGGSEMLGTQIAIVLRGEGYECAVCAIDKGGALEYELSDRGIPYRIINRKPREHLKTMWRVWRFFRETRPDIVHTHHLLTLLHSSVAAKMVGASIIHTEHDRHSSADKRSQRWIRILSFFCGAVTTVGEEITDYLRTTIGIPDKKLVTIPNGVDIAAFEKPTPLKRCDLGLKEGDAVIGTVGRLETVKDHGTLLKAFQIIAAERPNARLIIVGEGSEQISLERQARELGIADRVRFLGKRIDVSHILPLIDVFVLSSIKEGLPISILEAMAAGRPVISTKVGTIGDVIQDGVTGLLVDPKKHVDLAVRIEQVLSDNSFASALAGAARQMVRERYNQRRMIDRYMEIYRALRERRRAALCAPFLTRYARIASSHLRRMELLPLLTVIGNSLCSIVRMRIYTQDLSNDTGIPKLPPEHGQHIRRASIAEIEAVRNSMTTPPWEYSCHRYDGVRECFVYEDGGTIRHIGWIYYAGDPNRIVDLGRNEAEIKYCLTETEARGKGYYTATLVAIQRYLKEKGLKRVFISVRDDNAASIRGIEKAAFSFLQSFLMIKFLGIQFNRRYQSAGVSVKKKYREGGQFPDGCG